MTDRKLSQSGLVGQSHREPPTGSTGDRPDIGKPGGTVGRDVPEHSKEKDTEMAVEAGRKGEKTREHDARHGEPGRGRR